MRRPRNLTPCYSMLDARGIPDETARNVTLQSGAMGCAPKNWVFPEMPVCAQMTSLRLPSLVIAEPDAAGAYRKTTFSQPPGGGVETTQD